MAVAKGGRLARALGVVAACLGLTLLASTHALADCGNTGTAVLQGSWRFRTTTHYSGGAVPPQYTLQEGHRGSATGLFLSRCVAPPAGSCTVQLVNSASDQFSFSSNDTGLYTSGSSQSFSKSGPDYIGVFRISGYGGLNLPPCPPPAEFLTQVMHLHVSVAVQSGGAEQAIYLSGYEDSVVNWTCAGGAGVAGTRNRISFDAVPVGRAFPATASALCPVLAPAVQAVTAGTSGSGNAEVSTISSSLATPAASFNSLAHAAGNAVITLGIVLLITFPASIFNKTLEENYDDIRAMAQRRFAWLRRAGSKLRAGDGRARDMLVFGAVVAVGAAIGGLNDPKFGFNRASAQTFAGVVLAVLFGLLVSTTVGLAYRGARHMEVGARLTSLPAGLLVASLCVVVSRLTQFQPGYLYGVICGVAFTAQLHAKQEGHLAALSSAAALGVAVIAWFAWVPVHQAAAHSGAGAATVIAGDFLAAVFVGGLVGSVLGLVPLRFLPGGTLLAWSRAAWAGLFGLAVFGLLQVMLRPESSSAHTGTAAVVTAAVLFVVFGALSVGFRTYFGQRRRRLAIAAD